MYRAQGLPFSTSAPKTKNRLILWANSTADIWTMWGGEFKHVKILRTDVLAGNPSAKRSAPGSAHVFLAAAFHFSLALSAGLCSIHATYGLPIPKICLCISFALFAMFAFFKAEKRNFRPHIHTTWEKPLRDFLRVVSTPSIF